jgi:hypothetical protein
MPKITNAILGATVLERVRKRKLVIHDGQLDNTSFHGCWSENLEEMAVQIEKKFYCRPIKGPKKLLSVLGITRESFDDTEIFVVEKFSIIGDPLSTDVDAILFVPSLNLRFDTSIVEMDIRNLGYVGDFDFNYVVEKDSVLTEASKGTVSLTNNILLETHKHHIQLYLCPVLFSLPIDLKAVARITFKSILDHLKDLFGDDYESVQKEKRAAFLLGGTERDDAAFKLLTRVKLPKGEISYEFKSTIKSLTMKMIQGILGAEKRKMLFTKSELSRSIPEFREKDLMSLLTRKVTPLNFEVFQALSMKFISVYSESFKELVWDEVKINFENCTHFSNEVFQQILSSPLTPTDEYKRLEDLEEIDVNIHIKTSKSVPDVLVPYTEMDDQRSERWRFLQSYYETGAGGKFDISELSDMYHFLRGNVAEALIINTDMSEFFGDHEIYTVGMIAENKGVKGSKACSPDFLVKIPTLSEMPLPCEIKCIPGEMLIGNASYRRGVSLATKQLKTAADILKVNTGYIVLVYAHKNGFTACISKVIL